MSEFENPDLETIRALLERVHTVAVVGLSPKEKRPSYKVASRLQRFGYRIVPVRPAVTEILGEQAYATLDEVPMPIDIVDVFRAPEYVEPLVDACIRLGVGALWLQDGVVNPAAAARARDAGITVVMDRCMLRDYRRFFGDRPRAAQ